MTETEWHSCTDPTVLLKCLGRKVTTRKMLLFSVACCRRIWPLIEDEPVKKAVETIEKYADGLATLTELSRVEAEAGTWAVALDQAGDEDVWAMGYSMSWAAWAMSFAMQRADKPSLDAVTLRERLAQSALVRDIFTSPFSRVNASPSCQSSEVVRVAQAIYEQRAFHRMTELAGILQDAGCTNAEILEHCRQPGVHARGCWVVDLVLGKS